MTDPLTILDRIESDLSDQWDELHLTKLGYTKIAKPVAVSSPWGQAEKWHSSAQIGLGELRAALTPPPPPPAAFDPHTNWQRPPWNLDATVQPIDPNSADLISKWVARGNIRYPNVCTNSYSQAWCEGKAGDPLYDINVVTYGKKVITGVPIPLGTKPSPDSDAHLVIFDLVGKREIDLWQVVPSKWTAGSGDVYPLGSDPAPATGSNAAGFPSLALSIWPEEIQAGRIDHALAFSVLKAAPSHRYPATKHDGQGLADDLPEGVWMALPPSGAFFNSGWPTWVKPIYRALQDHGMFLMDQGGSLGIAGVCPINGGVKWSDVGMGTGGSMGFPSDFPWSSMRVLAPPTP